MAHSTDSVRSLKLTPEAQQLVDEAAKRWGLRLAAYAYAEHVASSSSGEEITVDDVREARRKVELIRLQELSVDSPPRRPSVRSRRAPVWARFLAILGALMLTTAGGILAAGQVLLMRYADEGKPIPVPEPGAPTVGEITSVFFFAILLGFVAISLGVFGIVRFRRRLERTLGAVDDKNATDLVSSAQFQQKWSTFEDLMRGVVGRQNSSIDSHALLGTVLNAYGKEAGLSTSAMEDLRGLLRLRNDFAHNREGVDPSTVAGAIRALDRHITQAEKMQENA